MIKMVQWIKIYQNYENIEIYFRLHKFEPQDTMSCLILVANEASSYFLHSTYL